MDVVVEYQCTPKIIRKFLFEAVGWTARGATVVVFGCAPAGKPMELCPEEVFRSVQTE